MCPSTGTELYVQCIIGYLVAFFYHTSSNRDHQHGKLVWPRWKGMYWQIRMYDILQLNVKFCWQHLWKCSLLPCSPVCHQRVLPEDFPAHLNQIWVKKRWAAMERFFLVVLISSAITPHVTLHHLIPSLNPVMSSTTITSYFKEILMVMVYFWINNSMKIQHARRRQQDPQAGKHKKLQSCSERVSSRKIPPALSVTKWWKSVWLNSLCPRWCGRPWIPISRAKSGAWWRSR